MQFSLPKRFLNAFFAVLTVAVLLGILYAARQIIRRITLEKSAEYISRKVFKGADYSVDHDGRNIVFSEKDVDFLKKYKLHGSVTFSFPVKFFEFPWQANIGRITVSGIDWELDLKNKKINGFELDEFLSSVRKELDVFKKEKTEKYPAFVTEGTLLLINPEGKKRQLAMKSIFQEFNDKTYLLGIHAGDMRVNFIYKDSVKKIVGQYLARQSDFEFFRLSFGIPELFDIHGVEKLSGEFRYDVAAEKLDFIRGSSVFGVQASIKGSVFTLYGNRSGKISWEYLNPQNWQIELRNATSVAPVRAGLHYFVLSQNTLEKDALSFDGEIEFSAFSFRDMFGLELDKRTSAIRHRIVGKWDMVRKSWELSRLETQKRVPQVKLRWNDCDVAFQWQNFKLSGRGAQADHFGFHYELDMSNFDWKDKKGNAVIGTQTKLEGDCILSLADDTLKPVSTGRISCAVADGAFGKSRFLVNNAFLNFSPDKNGKNKYYFSCAELKVGVPDLRNGVVCEMPRLEGSISTENIAASSPSLKISFRDKLRLEGGSFAADRTGNEKNIRIELPELNGDFRGKKIFSDKMTAELIRNGSFVYVDGKCRTLKYGDDIFYTDGISFTVEGGLPQDGNWLCRRVVLKPQNCRFKNLWTEISVPKASLSVTFNDKQIWHNWALETEKTKVKYRDREFLIPHFTAGELNNGKYCDGLLKNNHLPYRFDITYTRNDTGIILKNGRISFDGTVLWGLTGDIKLHNKKDFFGSELQYAEFKTGGMAWEHGTLGLKGTADKGFEINKFSGTSSVDMAKVAYIGRNEHGLNEFSVKNFSARYVEKALDVPEHTFSGMFEGKVAAKDSAVFNPFNIQTFYLKNNTVMRMRMGALEKFAGKGNSVEEDFAIDALKDFFAKTLTLDYHKVGNYMILNVNTLGKSTNLLPYEYDVKAKKLKKSDVALFNSEVEVSMKYMIKKP